MCSHFVFVNLMCSHFVFDILMCSHFVFVILMCSHYGFIIMVAVIVCSMDVVPKGSCRSHRAKSLPAVALIVHFESQ